MLKVRRSLTEILLEVTNEEISSVCREVWSRARAKGTPDTPDRTNRSIFRTFSYPGAEIFSFCCQFVAGDACRIVHLLRALKTVFPFLNLIVWCFQNALLYFFQDSCVKSLLHESLIERKFGKYKINFFFRYESNVQRQQWLDLISRSIQLFAYLAFLHDSLKKLISHCETELRLKLKRRSFSHLMLEIIILLLTTETTKRESFDCFLTQGFFGSHLVAKGVVGGEGGDPEYEPELSNWLLNACLL